MLGPGLLDCTQSTKRQLLSHLRLLNLPVGLLINFHVVVLRDGIRRIVNHYRRERTTEEEFAISR